MIRIIGNRGEGAGLLTNLAIEKILETQTTCLCFLIDYTSEFTPLVDKLNGITIHVSEDNKEYAEHLLSRLGEGNFFRFLLNISSEYLEYELQEIEKLVSKIKTMYSGKVYLIYKTVND